MKHRLKYPFAGSRAGRCLAGQVAVALLIFGSSAWAGESLPYRVAGILAVDDAQYRAVIELSADEQGIFRQGDALGNGTMWPSVQAVRFSLGSPSGFPTL